MNNNGSPSLAISLAPVIFMLASLIGIIIFAGGNSISDYSHIILLVSALVAVALAVISRTLSPSQLKNGLRRSASQILPAVPLLILIALISTTWLLSGVVPTLIDYGIKLINPTFFLVTTCAVCALVSVLTGSSWTTIATIGVAFIGIGRVMGYSEGWIAGAIISGAYFGDKVSPLSDTTVIASSSCGVDLFDHIRYLMLTAIPAMTIAMLTFMCVG
ncbi:MAG: sodium:proton antiporter, partial [Muribaculaceae bacterium]|nr:sodium:proton antiporter [Muribaculaceae bacterium]